MEFLETPASAADHAAVVMITTGVDAVVVAAATPVDVDVAVAIPAVLVSVAVDVVVAADVAAVVDVVKGAAAKHPVDEIFLLFVLLILVNR